MSRRISSAPVTIPVDDPRSPTMGGWLAHPVEPGDHPGVILAGEIFGLTRYVRDLAGTIAGWGFTVLVPDFPHRTNPGTVLEYDAAGRKTGLALAFGLKRSEVDADLAATVRALVSYGADPDRIGMVGLSSGGHLAYYAACRSVPAETVAVYPGWLTASDGMLRGPEPTVALTAGITGRVLLAYAGDDALIDARQRAAVTGALDRQGIRYESVLFDGAPHGFGCPDRPQYRAEAADRLLTLIADRLRALHTTGQAVASPHMSV